MYALRFINKDNFILLVALVACSFVIACSDARTAQASLHRFTIERLIGEAWSISPDIRGLMMLQDAAQDDVVSRYKGFFPAPGIEAQGRESDSYATFYIRQPIWSAGRLSSQLEVAKEQSQNVAVQESSMQLQLSLQVISDVESALIAHKSANIYRDGIHQLGLLLEMMRRRVGTGLSSKIEIEVVKTRLSSMKTSLATIGATEESALDRLTLVTGLPVEAEYIVLPALKQLPPRPVELDNEIVAAALSFSPDIKSRNSAYRLAMLEADITKTSLFPTIYAQAQYSVMDLDGTGEAEFFVGLDYPLSGGLAELEGVSAAKARAHSATFDVATAERDLRSQILSELHSYRALRDFLEDADLGIISTSEVLESYRRQFLVGEKSWLEVVNAVREKVDLELSRANAAIRVATNHLRLEARTGEIGHG